MNVAITFKDGSYICLSNICKIEPYHEADDGHARQYIAFYSDQREPSSLIDTNLIGSWLITRDR